MDAEAQQQLGALRATFAAAELLLKDSPDEIEHLRASIADLERRVDRLERVFATIWESLP